MFEGVVDWNELLYRGEAAVCGCWMSYWAHAALLLSLLSTKTRSYAQGFPGCSEIWSGFKDTSHSAIKQVKSYQISHNTERTATMALTDHLLLSPRFSHGIHSNTEWYLVSHTASIEYVKKPVCCYVTNAFLMREWIYHSKSGNNESYT